MPTLDQVDPSIIYALFKGEPGTRKSTAALSFPTPQYWFSWDRKMQGLLLPMKAWGIDPKLVTYDDYDDWDKAKLKLEKLQVSCPYNTLVFDSVTSCADVTLRQTIKAKKGETRQSGAPAGKKIANILVNEVEDFNAEAAVLQELISITKDIQQFNATAQNRKITIILIAHVVTAEYRSTVKPSDTHISRTIVTAAKKVAAKIPAYCSEVYHFNIKSGIVEGSGGDYSLKTTHTGTDFARTALPLDAEIVFNNEPLYSKWIKPAIDKLGPPNLRIVG